MKKDSLLMEKVYILYADLSGEIPNSASPSPLMGERQGEGV